MHFVYQLLPFTVFVCYDACYNVCAICLKCDTCIFTVRCICVAQYVLWSGIQMSVWQASVLLKRLNRWAVFSHRGYFCLSYIVFQGSRNRRGCRMVLCRLTYYYYRNSGISRNKDSSPWNVPNSDLSSFLFCFAMACQPSQVLSWCNCCKFFIECPPLFTTRWLWCGASVTAETHRY